MAAYQSSSPDCQASKIALWRSARFQLSSGRLVVAIHPTDSRFAFLLDHRPAASVVGKNENGVKLTMFNLW